MNRVLKVLFFILTAIIFVSALGTAGYFYYQYQQALQNPNQQTQQEIQEITQIISQYMELPDEQANLATVTDKSKFVTQPFFQNAENDDKILIFRDAKRAILYRPSTQKIIDVAPLITDQNNSANTSETSSSSVNLPAEPNSTSSDKTGVIEDQDIVSVAIYNSTDTPEILPSVKWTLVSQLENLDFVLEEKSTYRHYLVTQVINLTDQTLPETQQIADLLNAEITFLPEGETQPEGAEILIIIGTDQ